MEYSEFRKTKGNWTDLSSSEQTHQVARIAEDCLILVETSRRHGISTPAMMTTRRVPVGSLEAEAPGETRRILDMELFHSSEVEMKRRTEDLSICFEHYTLFM